MLLFVVLKLISFQCGEFIFSVSVHILTNVFVVEDSLRERKKKKGVRSAKHLAE